MTSSSVSILSPLRMLKPTTGCSFIFANSSSVRLAAFLRHRFWYTVLSYAVQPPAPLQPQPRSGVFRLVLHLPRDHQGVLGDPLRVTSRVGVACVNRVGQRLEGGDDDLFAVLEEPRVVDRNRSLGGQ